MCRLQLRAGGTTWRAVAEGKEKTWGDQARGTVGEPRRRHFTDRDREQGDPRRGDSDRGASSVAITEAAALP
jgi:hypothetical protein